MHIIRIYARQCMQLNYVIIYLLMGTFLFSDPPDWQVVDPSLYSIFPATIIAGIILNDGVNIAEEDDIFAAFDTLGNVRGVAVQVVPLVGPYGGQIVYEMDMYGNDGGDLLSFKYYDASEDKVYGIVETY